MHLCLVLLELPLKMRLRRGRDVGLEITVYKSALGCTFIKDFEGDRALRFKKSRLLFSIFLSIFALYLAAESEVIPFLGLLQIFTKDPLVLCVVFYDVFLLLFFIFSLGCSLLGFSSLA